MWTSGSRYCGLVNSVHPQYYPQCIGVEISSIVWSTVFTIFGALDATFLQVSLLSTLSLPQL